MYGLINKIVSAPGRRDELIAINGGKQHRNARMPQLCRCDRCHRRSRNLGDGDLGFRDKSRGVFEPAGRKKRDKQSKALDCGL